MLKLASILPLSEASQQNENIDIGKFEVEIKKLAK
jgi:hypothetical protein